MAKADVVKMTEDEREALFHRIDKACSKAGISISAFGRLVCGDSRWIRRVVDPKRVMLRSTLERAQALLDLKPWQVRQQYLELVRRQDRSQREYRKQDSLPVNYIPGRDWTIDARRGSEMLLEALQRAGFAPMQMR